MFHSNYSYLLITMEDIMKKIILTTLIAVGSTSLFGALSPFNQRNREFTKVLQDQEIQKKFKSNHQIRSIQRKGNMFVLRTNKCTLMVQVNYNVPKTNAMGPKPFKLIPGALVCE